MNPSKHDRIWREWMNLTERAPQPQHAPRPVAIGGRLPVGMAALASIVVIVAIVGSRLAATPAVPGGSPSVSPGASLSASPPVNTQPTSPESPLATPSGQGTPTQTHPAPAVTLAPALFTTPGAASSWKGFTWSTLPADSPLLTADQGIQVIDWRGGYVAYGTTGGGANGFVWTSTDGIDWRHVDGISAPQILVSVSPAGLVAIGGDPSAASPTNTVWTSPDGLAWLDAGSATGLAYVDAIAGTSAGLVAIQHTMTGSGKFATPAYSLSYSNDGIGWTPVTDGLPAAWNGYPGTLQSGNGRFFLAGNSTAQVASTQSGNGRFFLAGNSAALVASTNPGTGVVWWSDDGRAWAKSSGTITYPARQLYFGRDGILLSTQSPAVPGGSGIAISTDGGKSWHDDPSDSPVGPSVCGQGECSTGPDGYFGANGTVMVAAKTNGQAWISYDGSTWTSIAWGGPSGASSGPLLVLPRGVFVEGRYGAAQ